MSLFTIASVAFSAISTFFAGGIGSTLIGTSFEEYSPEGEADDRD